MTREIMHTRKQLGLLGSLLLLAGALTLSLAGQAGAQAIYVPSQVSDIQGLSQPVNTLRQIVTSHGDANYTTLSNGTDTTATSRVKYNVPRACGSLSLKYGNFTPSPNTGDTPGNAVITVKSSVEDAAGNITPVFFGGARSAAIQLSGGLTSDPIEIDLAAGATLWVRTNVSASAGGKWYSNVITQTADGEGVVAASDLTDSGTVTASFAWAYAPQSILGLNAGGRQVSVFIVGDSIVYGTGDANDTTARTGYAVRALYGILPWSRAAVGGDKATVFAQTYRHFGRMRSAEGATHALVEYGVNDITLGRTLAQIQADLIAIWQALSGRGVKSFQTTITPVSSSTDSWATTVNQTTTANNAVRVNLNNWIRNGAPMLSGVAVAAGSSAAGTIRAGATGHPLTGYFEVADTVESSRDSGTWKVTGAANAYTTDGTHPSPAGHAAAAAAITVASFRL